MLAESVRGVDNADPRRQMSLEDVVALLLRLSATPAPPSDAVFDSAVRDALLPRYLATPGVVDVLVGRNGETGRRLLVSVWDAVSLDDAGFDEAVELGSLVGGEATAPTQPRVLPVAVAVVQDLRVAEPRIIRVFHGRVWHGELDAYVEDIRQGAAGDAAEGGLVALYLATDGDRAFITVSAWTDWDALARATGGDVQQPDRTRHTERLEGWTVEHLEALPASPASWPRSVAGAIAVSPAPRVG